ncbi:hypothetical protein PHISCL_02030 [Aspergillus sclerotialis]|uniref:DUF2293 domain-containing protein n=1 Tax=Aspergillus sclerotialis TaxID=2070753 RepID=A0A3A2ZW49_9EURO|nr:hypothetical protein PHISCL_02030 [Aspergillus sclerotialis]
MESITQEKKKLRSVISFETEAPPGYTFIPAGNPRLTAACKEACRKDGLGVFAVTTTPHLRIHNLSQHVHRIGYHFPSAIVANVCMDLGLYLTATGKALPFYNVGRNEGSLRVNSEASQITINTEARDVLRDLFPNIPDTDLNQIIKTAFQKGQKKVGTAVELPLARRAQLAVVAHIRHVYTDYDRLLKTTSFHEARSQVEEPTLAKLVEWRGDDENGKTVLEDVFREVIVISDDEDTDTEGNRPPSTDSYPSVETISSNTFHEKLQARPTNYANRSLRESLHDLSDNEASPAFRIVPHVPKRDKIDRRGFSRYQAWDRAINRYRRNTNETDRRRLDYRPTDHQEFLHSREQPFPGNFKKKTEESAAFPVTTAHVSAASFTCPVENIAGSSTLNDNAITNAVNERRVSVEGEPIITPYYRCPQPQMYEANNPILTFNEPHGLYRPPEPRHQRGLCVSHLPEFSLSRAPTLRHEGQLFRQDDIASPPVFVSSLSKTATGSEGRLNHQPLANVSSHSSRVRLNPQDRVLPSIEDPQYQLPENNDQVKHLTEMVSDGVSLRSVTPRRLPRGDISYQAYGNNSSLPTPKRRRVAYYEPIRDDCTVGHYEPVNPIPPRAPKDVFAGDSFAPSGSILTRQSSAQDNMHSRRNYAVSVDPPYFARRHWDDRANVPSYSTHFNPELGFPPGWRSNDHTYAHLSHDQGVSSNTHGRVSTCHKLPSTNYVIPVDDHFGRFSPMHSSDLETSYMRRKKPEFTANGLGATGATESVVPSVHDMANDRTLAYNDGPRRRELYAEDFVRPVGLYGSDLSGPTPYLSVQINRTREASVSSLKGHDQASNESHGNTALMTCHSRPPFNSQAAYPAGDNYSLNYNQGTAYHRGKLFHRPKATGQFENCYQSPVRDSRERAPWPVDQDYLGYGGRVTKTPTHCSIPGDRPVIILD